VAKVKALYKELSLPSTYRTFEEQSYQLLTRQIQQATRGLPQKLFFKILENTYVRDE
jgi:farnesyl diphosphate synthase